MRKIALAIACMGLLGLASCKKDRSCTCTEVDDSGDATVTTKKFTKISKKDAKDACANSSTSYTYGGKTSTDKTTCELK